MQAKVTLFLDIRLSCEPAQVDKTFLNLINFLNFFPVDNRDEYLEPIVDSVRRRKGI